MCARSAALRDGVFFRFLAADFLLAHPASPDVVTRVNQNPEGPGNKARLPPKTRNCTLHLQKCFLDGVFSVALVAQQIAGEALHPRPVQRVQAFVAAEIAGLAGLSQPGVFAILNRCSGSRDKLIGRFHSPPPFAQRAGDFSLPRQRKSHRSHTRLLRYRRPDHPGRQGMAKTVWMAAKLLCIQWLSAITVRKARTRVIRLVLQLARSWGKPPRVRSRRPYSIRAFSRSGTLNSGQRLLTKTSSAKALSHRRKSERRCSPPVRMSRSTSVDPPRCTSEDRKSVV